MRSILLLVCGLLLLSAGLPSGAAAQHARATRPLDRHHVAIPTWTNPGSAHLYDKHTEFGLACITCHDERPPAKPVLLETCLSCHGSYDDLADKSDTHGAHNPHASHQGPIDCGRCHGVHRASVNQCGECHAFDMDVP